MFDKTAIKRSFSAAAQNYDQHATLQKQVRSAAIALAEDYFAKDAQVLDIGCGTGAFARETAWNVIGIDMSQGMCVVAQQHIAVINASANALPLKNDSVDAVFSSLMLQWADAPQEVIKEILRVLKPSGTAIITTFVHGTLAELEEAFKAIDNYPHISKFIPAPELLLAVAHAGAVVLETKETSYQLPYGSVVALMRAIKDIGASSKHANRKKGLTTASQLKKLEESYKKESGNITATWRALSMVIGKA